MQRLIHFGRVAWNQLRRVLVIRRRIIRGKVPAIGGKKQAGRCVETLCEEGISDPMLLGWCHGREFSSAWIMGGSGSVENWIRPANVGVVRCRARVLIAQALAIGHRILSFSLVSAGNTTGPLGGLNEDIVRITRTQVRSSLSTFDSHRRCSSTGTFSVLNGMAKRREGIRGKKLCR